MAATARQEALSPSAVWRGALAGLCAVLVGIGLARFAYTPLIPALVAAGWFTPFEAVYLGAANLAGYLAGALLARRLSLRVPAPTVLRAMMVATTLTLVACAWPLWGFWWFFPWRFAAGFTGAVLMVLAAPTVLARTPADRRGRVSGVVFTGVGLGIAASGTLVPALAGAGVTTVWLALAAASALLTALAWRGWPAEAPAAAESGAAVGATAPSARLTAPVVLLLLAYACDAIGFVPHTVFWVDYIARGLGHGLAAGGASWLVFGLAACAGPFLAGLMADRLGFGPSFVLVLLLKGAAVGLPLVSSAPLALALSAAIVGALTPATVALVSGLAGELVGPQHHRQVWGWMTSAFAVAQAAAAYGLSYLFAQSNAYHPLFAIGCAALLLGAACALAGSRRAATPATEAARRAVRAR